MPRILRKLAAINAASIRLADASMADWYAKIVCNPFVNEFTMPPEPTLTWSVPLRPRNSNLRRPARHINSPAYILTIALPAPIVEAK